MISTEQRFFLFLAVMRKRMQVLTHVAHDQMGEIKY